MLPQGERLLSQGEGTLSTTVAAPIATLALIKMVPLRFDAFPSTANHMNLLTPTILFLSPCTLFQLSPTLLTAHRPIIPWRKCRNNSLPSATSFLQDKWFHDDDCISSLIAHMPVDTWDDGSNDVYFNDIADPCILAACSANKKATKTEDSPSFDTAI